MTKSIAILGFGAGGRYLAAAIASPERQIQASDPMVEGDSQLLMRTRKKVGTFF